MSEGDGEAIPLPHRAPVGRSVLEEVEATWRAMRRGGRLPAHADLDPQRLASALPHALVLERMAPGVARLRFAGRALAALLGAEPRGMPLTSFFAPAARARAMAMLDRAFDGPAVVEAAVTAPRSAFKARLDGRLLLLPMLDRDGRPTRALGALLLEGPAPRAPRPLELREDRPLRVEPAEPVTFAVTGTQALAAAEAPRPYLRLVVSNP